MTMPFTDLEHLNIPFQYIIEATKNFTTIIGKGGYGPVYKGQLSLSGETELTNVAIKRLDTKVSGQGLKEFLTEIQLLSRYKHPNLVSLLAICDQGPEKVLVYEYAHLGSLDKYLRNAPNSTCSLTWKQRLNICIDAARGLDYLHNHVAKHERVIHRDIKSANVLLDRNWRAMIADFGLSKIGRANEKDSYLITNACGTHGYCDPVYLHTGILTKESDVYSFGVVLFEVLCGRSCFFMDVESKKRLLPQLAKTYYKKNKLNRIIDPTLKEYMDSNSVKKFSRIAYQCLLDDREGRPTMDFVLQELEKALKPLLYSSGDEDNKHEIDREATISLGNQIPMCLPESWDVPRSNLDELSAHSDLVATGALNSTYDNEFLVKNLLKVVVDYSVVALDPSKIEAGIESPLCRGIEALATMVYHRSLVIELVGKGLFNPNLMKTLLDDSSPNNVKAWSLTIVSKVAAMDKEFYKQINGADILQRLKSLLTHEVPNVRGWTCQAIGDMCKHSSYFYSFLAKHNIVSLLVNLLFYKDYDTQRLALFAILRTTEHSDLFYEDLRICIPQIVKMLLSLESTNLTKKNAAYCLGKLSTHSNKLSEDMISKGALEALLKVVADYSVDALDPSKMDVVIESPLYRGVEALSRMVDHRSLVDELVSKGHLHLNLIKRLLDDSSPTNVKVCTLQIVSKVALIDKEFYKQIDGVDILQRLQALLTHEVPNVRAWTCRAIGEMCIHSPYFYSLLAEHSIISVLVDRLFDKDNYPQRCSVYAILGTTKHSDLFLEDLRICIPQLAKLLLSSEMTNQTKKNVATCLGNFSAHSNKFVEDMISKGAMEALFKVVVDYSVVTIDPSTMDAIIESPLYKVVEALGTMSDHRSLAVEIVGKGFLNPNLMKRLLDESSPTLVKIAALKIVSKVAAMDKKYYKKIDEADIIQQLKALLTNEVANVRGWSCRAIGDMCKHSSYFYSLMAKHNIISLLVDRLSDKDINPQRVSVYAIIMISKHSDLFYEDLRVCIPQLAKLLVSAESTNLTKKNVACCFNNLSAHSNKLCEDMISKGAIEALLKVVVDYADVALDQCKMDDIIEFPVYKVVEALGMMCQHLPCSNFIGSIDVLPVFGQLCESPNKDIARLATLILKKAIKS